MRSGDRAEVALGMVRRVCKRHQKDTVSAMRCGFRCLHVGTESKLEQKASRAGRDSRQVEGQKEERTGRVAGAKAMETASTQAATTRKRVARILE
eukprot:456473-Rhodomonas_salina.1